jgi:hypothetical protein
VSRCINIRTIIDQLPMWPFLHALHKADAREINICTVLQQLVDYRDIGEAYSGLFWAVKGGHFDIVNRLLSRFECLWALRASLSNDSRNGSHGQKHSDH